MYYDESISRERNDRINKIIRLIQKAESKNEIINKTTLQKEDIGSSATLGRELSKIGDEGEKIITFDKHKLTFRMNRNWKSAMHIKSDSLLDYGSLGIMKSLLEQYQNTPLYKTVIDKIEELAEMPIEDFSRIAVPPKPEYNKEDQKKFSKIFDYMTQNLKIQFYYKGRWHGDERKNRVVCPYQLLLDNGTCYLYGYDEEKQDDRLFVLRRMEEIRHVNNERFDLPAEYEFSLKHGFSKFGAYT
ncbi:MAG: WYL domain-containing protein, partial [Clostridia bacterium]|nr:WYL domain-containing protein [Clostridia bacterium]